MKIRIIRLKAKCWKRWGFWKMHGPNQYNFMFGRIGIAIKKSKKRENGNNR